MKDRGELEKISRYVRYLSLVSTTEAGSGHPTSSLSAADLMVGLLFGGVFRFDTKRPDHPNNDRLIFSKGHAAPLLYALWVAAGKLTEEEAMSLRKFRSPLEGHPTPAFPYAEFATGSLGQGLSIGVGLALNAKYLDRLPYRTYVLLGDSEMTEGSQWESVQLAAHYHLDNLVGIIDVNRLGQRGETLYRHDLGAYESRLSAFGWETIPIDGHSFTDILNAYERAMGIRERPVMIIARTIKGRGVSFVEDRPGWHGKALKEQELEYALLGLGKVERVRSGSIRKPENLRPNRSVVKKAKEVVYKREKTYPTRKAYGNALKRIFHSFPDMVVLDAEVSNSTYSGVFRETYPSRFLEMYVAEQNMVGTAVGLSRSGKIPFVSTFAAFMTRAFDQIRMSRYCNANIKFCGSHAGVAIGEDGPSQMGLEDIAMFRTVMDGVVLYPSDAVSTEKLVELAAAHDGIVYIRTTRNPTPLIYGKDETFTIGGSKVLRRSTDDLVTIVSAGFTLHEALKAHEELKGEGYDVRVIDLYSIKPIDRPTLVEAARETHAIITVEDHFDEGGLGEAVMHTLADEKGIPILSLAVRKMPVSGKPDELLNYEQISKNSIIETTKKLIRNQFMARGG